MSIQVITAGGYREPITLQQIRTNMEMESHEENLHNMIKISKMETAKDQARDAAASIRARQAMQQKTGAPTGIGGSSNESQPGRHKLSCLTLSSPIAATIYHSLISVHQDLISFI